MTVLFEDDSGVFYGKPFLGGRFDVPFPMRREDLARYVRMYADKGIDYLSWDTLVNGVASYDSKVAPHVFEGRTDYPPHENHKIEYFAENTRQLIKNGDDPLAVVVDTAHAAGMKAIACVRPTLFIPGPDKINSGGGIFYNPRTTEMTDCVIENLPEIDDWYSGWGSHSQPLDWRHAKVRAMIAGPMREMAFEYDVDGLGINFLRSVVQFGAPVTQDDLALMTQFIRDTRAMLDEAAQSRGVDRLMLAVRVPDRIEACNQYGMDVAAWIRDGLIDFVMPGQTNDIDFDAPVEPFAKLCQGTQCQLLPTIGVSYHQDRPMTPQQREHVQATADASAQQDRIMPHSFEELCELAHGWYEKGAAGVSAFNFHHRPPVDVASWDEAVGWFKALGDPAKVASIGQSV